MDFPLGPSRPPLESPEEDGTSDSQLRKALKLKEINKSGWLHISPSATSYTSYTLNLHKVRREQEVTDPIGQK